LRGDITQAELVLGWRTVPALHEAAPALDLAAAILGSGRGSMLYRSLRETGIVTSVSAGNYSPTELGVFSIGADLAPGEVPVAVEKMAECVARLSLLGPSREELERARTLLTARWARRLEPMEGKGSAVAAAEALEHVSFLDREYALLQTVQPEEVREVTARYLQADSVSAVAYLPETEGDDLTPQLLERSFAVTALRGSAGATPAARATPPAAPATGRWKAEVLHTALAGADLLVRRKAGVPLVALGIYAPRIDFDPSDKAGLGALTIRSSVRAAGDLDAGALAFAFERLGGTLSPSATADWLGFGTTVLNRHLGEAADLLNLVYTAPRLAQSEVTTERELMAQEAEQVADDMFRYPFQLGFAAAFGDRAYGLPVGGWAQTIPSISPEDVREWHARGLLGVRPVIVAVGDIDPEQASGTLAGVFKNHPAPATMSPRAPILRNGAEEASRVVSREKAQAALAMIFPGPGRRDPDRYAAEVWAAVASGLGGRMFEALRDRRSLAYTVLASSWQRGRAGALVTYIATSPEREEEARSAMLDELQEFRLEPVSEVELTQAVNYLAGQAEVSRQSVGALAGEMLEAWLIGNGLDDLKDPAAAFRAVTAEDVLRVARSNLKPEQRAEGVVRGTGLRATVAD
ncbi:MAG: peptidase domain protein, partial [Geminicoccaceae bacterium]|nr:peptidase domain protein [Geminicoccaceae bacterium]